MSGIRRGDYFFSEAEILRIKSDNDLEDERAREQATKERHPCVVEDDRDHRIRSALERDDGTML